MMLKSNFLVCCSEDSCVDMMWTSFVLLVLAGNLTCNLMNTTTDALRRL